MKRRFYKLFAVFFCLIQLNGFSQDGYILVVGSSTDDQSVLDILTDDGYTVVRGLDYSGELTAVKLDSVNGADLVIFSRNGLTSSYGDSEALMQQWADVEAPILSLSPWIMRNNRWRWIFSTALSCAGSDSISIPEDVKIHSIYKGVDVSSGFLEVLEPGKTRNEKFSNDDGFGNPVGVGSGTILALDPHDDGIMAAEWKAGSKFYEETGIPAPTAGSNRMWLGFITEGDNCPVDPNVMSAFNGNDAAKTIFLNAVDYMIKGIYGSVSNSVSDQYSVFPNPATDILSIRGLITPANYEIVDLAGAVVLQGHTENSIDISQLNTGIYILRMSDINFTVKFVKQ